MVCLWLLGVLLALSAHVTRGADDSGFERYECYRDMCVSRLQFCSDRERRCKYCQPGHCVDKEKTPKACLPLCPQLLNPPTTPPPSTTTTPRPTTTAGKTFPDQETWTSVRANGSEVVQPAGGVTQQGGLFLPSGVLIPFAVVVVVVLVALVILAACTLRYVRRVLRRLPAAPDEASDRSQDGLLAEEASQALLESGLGSKAASGTNCSGSASTVSSQPPKPTSRPGSFKRGITVQTQTEGMDLAPPCYTARPSNQLTSGPHTGVAPHSGNGATALPDTQHCLLDPSSRLLTTQGQSWTDVGAVRQGFAGHPRTGQLPTSWEDHGQQHAFDRYREETFLKSV